MPPPRSSRRRPCSTTSAFGASYASSPRAYAPRARRSGPTSCEASSSKPLSDSLGVLEQHPVVVPRSLRDGERDVGPDADTGRAHRLLLRVAPPVPRALDGRVDELHPVHVLTGESRWWQRQHLPLSVLAHQR